MILWTNVYRPIIADRLALRRYVVSVTIMAWLVAITVDVANQLTFFTNWADCFREWSITTAVVIGVAVPIARSMGNAHLQLHHAKRVAELLSRTDPLTGLANRRAFYEAASQLKGGALALVIADIDRFKRFNDSYGHMAGDEVIKAVAATMQAQLGDLGAVARVGGEEFALVCAETRAGDLGARLHAFRQRVSEQPVLASEQSLYATISIGFALRRDFNFDELYAAADQALYVAKSAGRDRVVDFDEIAEITAPTPLTRAG